MLSTFLKRKRTTLHFYKRAPDVYDHYEYDENTKRFVRPTQGRKIKENNKWILRYKISSMIPEEDSLNFSLKVSHLRIVMYRTHLQVIL